MSLWALRLLAIILLSAVVQPIAAEAQQPRPVARIGVLWPVSDDPTLEAFRHGLRDVGYVDGQTIAIEYRYAAGQDSRLPELAAELVGLKVDLIVTWGVTAARAATKATTTIPIVNGSMSDPVRAGLVASLARPGGNLTGLTSMNPEISAKRLELMRELVPGLARLAVLATSGTTAVLTLRETEAAAQSLGIAMQAVQVREPREFDGAYSAMARERAEALIVLPDLMFVQHLGRLIGLADEHRLPTMYFGREFVDGGGLMAYAPAYRDQFRRAAVYVDKILKGANPADLPVEGATKFDLVINLNTAKALGLAMPPSILARADEVIE